MRRSGAAISTEPRRALARSVPSYGKNHFNATDVSTTTIVCPSCGGGHLRLFPMNETSRACAFAIPPNRREPLQPFSDDPYQDTVFHVPSQGSERRARDAPA